jgi:hypothetical protein
MNEHTRISDADREHVAERLRENYAEGRLSSEELDERIAAVLSAKTYGDLRSPMADLPEPAPVPPQHAQPQPWGGRRVVAFRRGPRIFPLLLIALIAAVVIPGAGWVLFAFLKVMLVAWLVVALIGVFTAARFRRHVRRYWQSGQASQWQRYEWRH